MQHDQKGHKQNRLPRALLCLHGFWQQRTSCCQDLQVPEIPETRIMPKWFFPPCFSDKNRFIFSCPDAVLVAPISTKTKKQQTSKEGGWVLRSGTRQLRETRSTSAAPPAISRSTFPRQHRPKDLGILQHDIHLIEIEDCVDTRHQKQLNAVQEQHRGPRTIMQDASTSLQIILLDAGGTFTSHNNQTMEPFKDSGLGSQRGDVTLLVDVQSFVLSCNRNLL